MDQYQIFLNGQWHDSAKKLEVTDPATNEPFAEVATVTRSEMQQALQDAALAFTTWKNLTAKVRGEYLRTIAANLANRSDRISRLITRENGKPLAQAQAEVNMAIDHLLWFADEGRRAYGQIVPHQADGKRHLVIKQPVGVVGAIAPWNFPLVLATRKLAPALVAGCPVILKPASATPLSAIEFCKCIESADLPQGVFQLVVGSATEIAQEMIENRLCRKISFTGSSEVGRKLIESTAKTCTPLSLELGGNAPCIIFDDADFDQAIDGALITKFRNNGQSCIGSNRLYVHHSIHDRFVEAFVARVKDLKVGYGLDSETDIGPLIDKRALTSALSFIDDAVKEGAKILTGGERYGTNGNYLKPTVLTNVSENAKCYREEIFAPIAAIYAFDNEEDVIAKANDTEYGLAAYAYTNDLRRAFRISEALEAGTVGINDPVPSTSNCPFGGVKQSGWGRELGSVGIDAYLETKHVSIAGID